MKRVKTQVQNYREMHVLISIVSCRGDKVVGVLVFEGVWF
jgi:hypothetical protein